MENNENSYICAHCGKLVIGNPDTNTCECIKEWLGQNEEVNIKNDGGVTDE